MKETIDTENKSLNKWIVYFNKNKIDNNLFILYFMILYIHKEEYYG